LCDRVAIMYKGKVVDSGTLPDLAERHNQNDFEELFFQLLMMDEAPAHNKRRFANELRAGAV
jgi:sodium transport system ATP-binding protein